MIKYAVLILSVLAIAASIACAQDNTQNATQPNQPKVIYTLSGTGPDNSTTQNSATYVPAPPTTNTTTVKYISTFTEDYSKSTNTSAAQPNDTSAAQPNNNQAAAPTNDSAKSSPSPLPTVDKVLVSK